MATEWLTAGVTLPRWVVWGALLTQPAIWSERFAKIVRSRLPGPSGSGRDSQEEAE